MDLQASVWIIFEPTWSESVWALVIEPIATTAWQFFFVLFGDACGRLELKGPTILLFQNGSLLTTYYHFTGITTILPLSSSLPVVTHGIDSTKPANANLLAGL